MFSKSQIIELTKEQLAIECNCSAIDFDKKDCVITLPTLSNKRRKFSNKPFFFKMTTIGGNAVISADACLHEWLNDFVKDKTGHWLFEHTNLRDIDAQLGRYGKQLFQTHHMFLPLGKAMSLTSDIEVKWFEKDEIKQFYEEKKYPNAFCDEYNPDRPDMLAVAALNGEKIIGMAGCSADTPLFWQIGIDVNSDYRGKGIGTKLVSLLKDEVFSRGKIPYYGTSLSNIHSWKIALNCGFSPFWIDTETVEL